MRAGRGQTESGPILGVVIKGARKSPMVTKQTEILYRRFIQEKCSIGDSLPFHDSRSGIVSDPAWIKQTIAMFHAAHSNASRFQ
jgi:hypothetical protein